MRKILNNVPHEKGQSLMELAVSAVVLLVLLAALIDLGRVIFYYLAMRDAAEEGMVYGSIYPTSCTQIAQAVTGNMNDTSVNVKVQYSTTAGGVADQLCNVAGSYRCAGNTITVTVRQPNFEMTMPMLGGWTFPLEAKISGTVIRPSCGP